MSSLERSVAARRPSVAWLDDDIVNYSGWVDALVDAGLDVTTFTAQTLLLEASGRTHYDLVIVDERLKNAMGSSLLLLLHAKSPRSRFLFLSAYFVQEDLYSKLADLISKDPKLTIYAIEKSTAGNIGSEEFRKTFVEPVVGYATGVLSEAAAPALEPREVPGRSNHFNISFSDYRDMDPEARQVLSLNFLETRREVIDGFFSRGSVWLCFFGDATEPVHVAASRDEIPDLGVIDREAADRGIAAFCVGSFKRVESIRPTSASCSKYAGLKGYNYLSYEIGKERVRSHYDSGAYDMFLNSRWLVRIGMMTEAVSHTTYETSLGVIYVQDKDVNVILDLVTGETRAIRYKAMAVRNFETSVLVARCGPDCGNGHSSMCHLRRHGLIGRGILVDNELRWQVDRDFEVIVVPI